MPSVVSKAEAKPIVFFGAGAMLYDQQLGIVCEKSRGTILLVPRNTV